MEVLKDDDCARQKRSHNTINENYWKLESRYSRRNAIKKRRIEFKIEPANEKCNELEINFRLFKFL